MNDQYSSIGSNFEYMRMFESEELENGHNDSF